MQKVSDCFRQAETGTVTIPEGWGQGRTTFGGLVGGMLFAHLQHAVGKDKLPRSATINFVAPVQSGVETHIDHEIFRAGKHVTQAQARLLQNGQVMAVMMGSFGDERASNLNWTLPFSADMPPADTAFRFEFVPGVMPDFIKQFDLRIAEGSLPFSASEPTCGGYVGFAKPWQDDTFEMAHLVTLVDVCPPSVLMLLSTPAPASSMAWTLEFVRPLKAASMHTLWRNKVTTDFVAHGYSHSRSNIFNAAGELTIISRQTVTVFG